MAKRVAQLGVVGVAIGIFGGRSAANLVRDSVTGLVSRLRHDAPALGDAAECPATPRSSYTRRHNSLVEEPKSEVLGATGEGKVGNTISIVHYGEFVFLWQRATPEVNKETGDDTSIFYDIPDASGASYTCQLEDAGKVLRVVYQLPEDPAMHCLYPNDGLPIKQDIELIQSVRLVPLAMYDVDVCSDDTIISGHQLVLSPKFILLKSSARLLCHEKFKTWPQSAMMCAHEQRALFIIQRSSRPEAIEVQFSCREERDQAVYLWHAHYTTCQAKAAKGGLFRKRRSLPAVQIPSPEARRYQSNMLRSSVDNMGGLVFSPSKQDNSGDKHIVNVNVVA